MLYCPSTRKSNVLLESTIGNKMKTLFRHKDIEILSDDTQLIINNNRISRKLDLSLGAPKTISLSDASGREFASRQKKTADLAFVGMHAAHSTERVKWHITDISAQLVQQSYKDSEHVKVLISMEEPFSETKYFREYLIYPNFPAISVQNSISLQVQPLAYWTNRGEMNKKRYFTNQRESIADSICCAENYQPELAVLFRGRTDETNELVVETPVLEQEFVCGNLLFCNGKDGSGFLFLQEAPPSEERRDLESYDFHITGKQIDSCCWGIHPAEACRGSQFTGYRHDLIVYSSSEEQKTLLKQFIRLRYPEKSMTIMVNPWGCGKFREYISEEFLLEEMKASGKIGADFYQIDDEWQTGKSLANLQNYNRRVREDFWTISQERLYGSFNKVISAAKKAGVKPALWFAPSMNCEYEDWKYQAEMLLDFYRKYGFTNFKIDGMLIRTKKAEDNLRLLLEYVREKSDGKVYFNLDTTNGQRQGYWFFLEYGNIFLENRYCYIYFNAEYSYHPEKTLRNLWDLSKYLDPADLQIEIPCPDDIQHETYKDFLEKCPDSYSLEYWAAIALFANPLIWTAPSKIKESSQNILRKISSLHHRYRDQLIQCEIYPIGSRPDGSSVTGFLAINKKMKKSFLLLFRELQSQDEKVTLALPACSAAEWSRISGEGNLQVLENGVISVEMPRKQYLFAESL
jgi:hypothetical protein